MAQEKNMNEKPKRTRKPKAKDEALPVEQITELMLVHNKNDPKAGVRAVSGIDGQGKVKTVPADERNENSFLKFDKTQVSSRISSRISGASSRTPRISG